MPPRLITRVTDYLVQMVPAECAHPDGRTARMEAEGEAISFVTS